MNQEMSKKAQMCLNCKIKPCSLKGCPLNNDIPSFINQIKQENYKEAYNILTKTTVLPAICGRICPHYKQCMGSCVRGIKGDPVDIGSLEAFVGDVAIEEDFELKKIAQLEELEKLEIRHKDENGFKEKNKIESNNKTDCIQLQTKLNNKMSYSQNQHSIKKAKRIAIVGGGPAGLTCAAFLAMSGNKVTIYEKYNYLGGLLVHGIPEFRLPRDITNKSIKKILNLGIEVKYNQELGKNLSLDSLQKQYDNVILSFGANVSLKIGIEGESLEGVYGGNELLEYNNHPNYEGKTVVVNGGGNVAMDTARTIKRLGAKKVIVIYRRAREQMPAEQKEIDDALNEGVEFLFQHNIVKILGNKKVEKIELVKTELVKKEGETRLSPVNIKDSNYEVKVDFVVMAIGSHTADFVKNLGLELNKYGNIKVDENGRTSNPKIYAIGDLSGNTQTVAWAARSGRDVAYIVN